MFEGVCSCCNYATRVLEHEGTDGERTALCVLCFSGETWLLDGSFAAMAKAHNRASNAMMDAHGMYFREKVEVLLMGGEAPTAEYEEL